MSTDLATPTTAVTSIHPDETPHAGYVTTVITAATRTLKQFFRTPQILMMGTIQGALFLFMFRYVFGGAIGPVNGLPYVDYMVPGFLTTVILWTGMSAGAGVAEDSSAGVYDRLRSLPIPRSAVMVGRALADTGLVAWGVFTTGIIAFLIGFRAHGGVGGVLLGFLLILAGGAAFTWVFIMIGLVAGNAQAAQGLSMLVVPFSFVSNANVPVASMPGWMQPFAANQPVSVLITAVRCAMHGGAEKIGVSHSTTYWVIVAMAWCVGIIAVFLPLAAVRFGRRR